APPRSCLHRLQRVLPPAPPPSPPLHAPVGRIRILDRRGDSSANCTRTGPSVPSSPFAPGTGYPRRQITLDVQESLAMTRMNSNRLQTLFFVGLAAAAASCSGGGG